MHLVLSYHLLVLESDSAKSEEKLSGQEHVTKPKQTHVAEIQGNKHCRNPSKTNIVEAQAKQILLKSTKNVIKGKAKQHQMHQMHSETQQIANVIDTFLSSARFVYFASLASTDQSP